MKLKCHVISDDNFFISGFRDSINPILKINVEFYNINSMKKKLHLFPGDLVIVVLNNVHLRHYYLSQFNFTHCRLIILQDNYIEHVNMKHFPWLLSKNISIDLLSKFIHKAMRTYVFYDEIIYRSLNIFRHLSVGKSIREISTEFKICRKDIYKMRRNILLKYGLYKYNCVSSIFLCRDILESKSPH